LEQEKLGSDFMVSVMCYFTHTTGL